MTILRKRVRSLLIKAGAMALSASALAACVSLEVDRAYQDPVSTTGANAGKAYPTIDAAPHVGSFTYALPQTVISVSGTVTLNDCDRIVMPDTAAEETVPIDISENFTVSSFVVADPNQQYSIPYDKLRSWTKQINISVGTYPNKALQNINGAITDQAGPIFLATVQAAVAIGGASDIPRVPTLPVYNQVQMKLSLSQRNKFKKLFGHGKAFKLDDLRNTLSLTSDQAQAIEPLVNAIATPTNICRAQDEASATRPDVQDALTKIHKITQAIKDLLEVSNKPVQGAISTSPSANDPQLLRYQNEINAIIAEYGLTRQFTVTWTPTRAELAAAYHPDSKLIILEKPIDLFNSVIVPAWLSTQGQAKLKSDGSNPIALRLKKKLVLTLAIQPWTVGRDYTDAPLSGGSADRATEPSPDGIVIRDPAIGILRTCLDNCVGALQLPNPQPLNEHDDIYNLTADVSYDVAAPLQLAIPQLGRFDVEPLKNALFESSGMSTALNGDSSISSMGNQTSNSIGGATGIGALTSAANAEASAIAAHNTAVTSKNTAETAAATYADTVNKALADCLAQQLLIIKSGGRPIGSCQ